MAFKDVLFPESLCVTYQSHSGTRFNTTIAAPGGDDTEDRNAEWGANHRRYFNPIAGGVNREQLDLLRSFYNVVRGRAYSFRLNWPDDNAALDSLLANTAGGTSFQLRKGYRFPTFADPTVYEESYQRIALCLPSTVFLTVNGQSVPVAQNPDFNYLFNDPLWNASTELTASVTEAGVITFSQSLASTDEIRASFNFHYKVRFDTDDLQEQYTNFGSYTVTAPIIEVNE